MAGENLRATCVCTVLCTLCTLFGLTERTWATPITFVFTGRGAGTLNGTAFGPANFTITSFGDTANRQGLGHSPETYFINHDSSQIAIDGVATVTVLTGTRTFIGTGSGLVGYSRAGNMGLDLYTSTMSSALANWNMLGAIGPAAGNGSLQQWVDVPQIVTDAGILLFAPQQNIPATFAAFVPEPGPSLLCGSVVLCLLRRVRPASRSGKRKLACSRFCC